MRLDELPFDLDDLIDVLDAVSDPNDCSVYTEAGREYCAEHNDEPLPCPNKRARQFVRTYRERFPK